MSKKIYKAKKKFFNNRRIKLQFLEIISDIKSYMIDY